MQTTLRLNDAIFREAKTEAAKEGLTLTRFLEEALTIRVRAGREAKAQPPLVIPVFDSGARLPKSFNLTSAIRESGIGEDQVALKRILHPASKARRS